MEYRNIDEMLLDYNNFSSRTLRTVHMKLPVKMYVPIFTAESYLLNVKNAFKSKFFNIFTSFFLDGYYSKKIFVKDLKGFGIEEKMPLYMKIFLMYIYGDTISSTSFFKKFCKKLTYYTGKKYFAKDSVKYIKPFI